MRSTSTEPHSESYPKFPREARVRSQLDHWLEEMEEWATRMYRTSRRARAARSV